MTTVSGSSTIPYETEPLRLVNTGPANKNEYSGGCHLFRAVAEGHGVRVTEQEIQDWEILLGASFIIETLMDERRQDIRPLIDDAMNGRSVPGVADEAVEQCRAYIARQEPERQITILDGLYRLGDFPSLYLQAHTAEELAGVRAEEADIYGNFLKLPVSDGQADADERYAFNRWIECFSRSGYAVDSLYDLRRDYRDGVVAVEPTLRAHAVLAKVAIKELVPGLRATPLRAIGRTASVAINYVVGERTG